MAWDLELILVAATAATGLIYYGHAFWYRLRRQAPPIHRPWFAEWSHALFPVLLLVLVLRTFAVEPFRIPSGSMIPTLLVGDLVLVNKYSYGLRLPVLHTRILELGKPERGDVVVFRYPKGPNQDYIKRVVGLPGDEVAYVGKRLMVNREVYPLTDPRPFLDAQTGLPYPYRTQFTESIGGRRHEILHDALSEPATHNFTVPPGHYLVMGDNRDSSRDSRDWGYVPESHLVGRAFLVWMNHKLLLPSLTNPEVSLLSRLGTIE